MIEMPTNIICGYFDCYKFKGKSISPKRIVKEYEIEYYLSGDKYTFCNENKYLMKKNSIQIAKPGQVRHSLLPFTTFHIKFSATGVIAERLEQATEYFEAVHSEKIQKLFRDIILLSDKYDENNLTFCGKTIQLIDLILSDANIQSTDFSTPYETISAAKNYIKSNYSSPITLADIAKSVNLSQTYFHKMFSSAVGCSPHEYLIKYRINHAKRLLWSSKNEISEIAISCGFGCQQYMNKVFKSYTGTTPREYRKASQDNYLL